MMKQNFRVDGKIPNQVVITSWLSITLGALALGPNIYNLLEASRKPGNKSCIIFGIAILMCMAAIIIGGLALTGTFS